MRIFSLSNRAVIAVVAIALVADNMLVVVVECQQNPQDAFFQKCRTKCADARDRCSTGCLKNNRGNTPQVRRLFGFCDNNCRYNDAKCVENCIKKARSCRRKRRCVTDEVPTGGFCQVSSDCVSSICVGGVCLESQVGPGELCGNSLDCSGSNRCVNDKCVIPKSTNQRCSVGYVPHLPLHVSCCMRALREMHQGVVSYCPHRKCAVLLVLVLSLSL